MEMVCIFFSVAITWMCTIAEMYWAEYLQSVCLILCKFYVNKIDVVNKAKKKFLGKVNIFFWA